MSVQRTTVALICLVAFAPLAAAQDKDKKPDDKQPVARLANPLAVVQGATTKVTLRGHKLDEASEVKIAGMGGAAKLTGTAKLLGKGKTPVPDKQDVKRVGDTQVEIEIVVPDDVAGEAALTVVTPGGESAPYLLLIAAKDQFVAEKELNGGFRDAQPLAKNKLIVGSISSNRDVDVFKYGATAGEKVTFDVQAARCGSVLDAVLTVYNAQGHVVATMDDLPDSPDATLTVTFAAAGPYYVSLIDALDLGGPGHSYLLRAQAAP